MNIYFLLFIDFFCLVLVFSSAAQPQLPAGILFVFSMVSSTPFYICFFVLFFCSVPSFEVPVRLIGGRLNGITLLVNSFDTLVSKSIATFNRCGSSVYHSDFVPLQPPIGFFFHFPIDRNDERQFVSSDADLQWFVEVHGFQPLLLFRGSTPPDKPTPPSSPGHSKPKSSSSSSRVSVSQDVRDYIYLRDHSRCCFSGEPLVRPTIGGPNQQILHLFPATTNYDPEETELQQLPLCQHIEDFSTQITKMTLYGTEVVDYWVSKNGTLYALVVLTRGQFKGSINQMNSLSGSLKGKIIEGAEKSFDEIDKIK